MEKEGLHWEINKSKFASNNEILRDKAIKEESFNVLEVETVLAKRNT